MKVFKVCFSAIPSVSTSQENKYHYQPMLSASFSTFLRCIYQRNLWSPFVWLSVQVFLPSYMHLLFWITLIHQELVVCLLISGVTIKISVWHKYGINENLGVKLLILRLSFFSHTATLLSVPGVLALLISIGSLFRLLLCLFGRLVATPVYILSKAHEDLMVHKIFTRVACNTLQYR